MAWPGKKSTRWRCEQEELSAGRSSVGRENSLWRVRVDSPGRGCDCDLREGGGGPEGPLLLWVIALLLPRVIASRCPQDRTGTEQAWWVVRATAGGLPTSGFRRKPLVPGGQNDRASPPHTHQKNQERGSPAASSFGGGSGGPEASTGIFKSTCLRMQLSEARGV